MAGNEAILCQLAGIGKVGGLKEEKAPKTLANFLERKTQLYEQGADVRRIGQYVSNWWRWVRAGVDYLNCVVSNSKLVVGAGGDVRSSVDDTASSGGTPL